MVWSLRFLRACVNFTISRANLIKPNVCFWARAGIRIASEEPVFYDYTMTQYQKFTDALFQIGTLQQHEKDEFISSITSEFESHGFTKVTKRFGGEHKYSKAVRFEKMRAKEIGEWIEIVFDKYGKRSFYIHCGVSQLPPTPTHIQLGNLVMKQSQYQYWWGTKWYTMFRKWKWNRETKKIRKYIPQVISYVVHGTVGKNIKDRIIN